MGRITRAESQERNRARVLAAAREEFAGRGFRDVKIDDIAERAGLTRGAVYSNFPGKRALFFSVLADAYRPDGSHRPDGPDGPLLGDARSGRPSAAGAGGDVAAVLGAVARAWLDDPVPGSATAVWRELVPQVQADEASRSAFAQLMTLYATLLGLAMERLDARPGRRLVRVAAAALTMLQGASQRAALASGLADGRSTGHEHDQEHDRGHDQGDDLGRDQEREHGRVLGHGHGWAEPGEAREDLVRACERLAGLDPGPAPLPPVLALEPYAADGPWAPPAATDALRGTPVDLGGDGLLLFLGLRRLSALEEAVRAAPAGLPVTVVVVTGDPGELGPLARFALARVGAHLRAALPPGAWPGVRVVCDESGRVAAAAGTASVRDETESAVRVSAGRLVRRADGRGAGYALASEAAGDAESRGTAGRSADPGTGAWGPAA
ncbi:TetR/AcrR family transcriptional regulator [Nonomuraea sp. 3-1Str]|uniref:helix-turn-helix domain-containing protein n=1 Tax=Nonomuraea sp. 3-1Str TaxID=2929801 RepID=UPI002863D883|nr:helix-turn-helix domain-containing protein [Nonomuraea sp. 3-1Str]MDR8410905.1 TetR/AcrR family transcriptional regulator [Nonomuraea sp. 3-1Str]